MPSLQIGFPPVVFEVQLKELGQLGKYVDRLLSRRRFVGYFHIVSKHSGKCLDVLEGRGDDCGDDCARRCLPIQESSRRNRAA
jgi:hypothetical protein